MGNNTYLKNFIKFLTFGYYFITKLKPTDYFRYIEINYFTALHRVEQAFINAGLGPEFKATHLDINYNKFDIVPLSLATFAKKKKEILNKTRHIYLLSLKYENLIPYKEYKIKNLALSNLFSLQFESNTVYAVKLDDICRLIESYFITLNKYYVNECLDGLQMTNALNNIFQIADHYFSLFTELHLVTNYVFYKENKRFKKYPVIYSDDQFNATINLIKERITKTIIIEGKIRKKEYLFEQKYKKTFNDILLELNLHQDYKIVSGNYTFENMKKFNLQDFILYIAILRNILSL